MSSTNFKSTTRAVKRGHFTYKESLYPGVSRLFRKTRNGFQVSTGQMVPTAWASFFGVPKLRTHWMKPLKRQSA